MPVTIQTSETITCKHCGSTAIVKYGSYKGVPRYFCKSCQRKFKADDKQFQMKTPTEQVATALHDYYDGGSSVRAIGRHILQETGSTPSTATIYEWIQKYTQYITDSIKDYHPKVGDTWIADETVVKVGGQQLWLHDVIDSDTRYLLATRFSTSRTTKDAQMLMDRAIRMAGKNPRAVITDKWTSYLDVRYGKDTEHRQGSPFSTEDSTSLIERWHGTVKARTKVMRGLKNLETAHDFVDGFLAYYNYLRPHEALDNKTPAEVAGIAYPYKNWADIISKHKPSVKVQIIHVERGTLRLPKTQIGRPRVRLTPQTPRISPPTPTISNAIYERRGMLSRHSLGRGSKTVARGKLGRGYHFMNQWIIWIIGFLVILALEIGVFKLFIILRPIRKKSKKGDHNKNNGYPSDCEPNIPHSLVRNEIPNIIQPDSNSRNYYRTSNQNYPCPPLKHLARILSLLRRRNKPHANRTFLEIVYQPHSYLWPPKCHSSVTFSNQIL